MTRSRRSTRDAADPSDERSIPGEGSGADSLGTEGVVGGDPEVLARAIVLRRLTRAPQTRSQLAEALAARGVPEDAARQVLDRMADVGLVNDAEFTAMYVRSRRASRGLAPRVLAAELRTKGVDEAIIRAELDGIEPDDDRQLAASLVARRAPLTAGLDPEARRRRLVGMLLRKGFPPGMAFEVVASALREEDLLADEA